MDIPMVGSIWWKDNDIRAHGREVRVLGIELFLLPLMVKGSKCDHRWRYDPVESAKPYSGYCERCVKCGAISQVPL